MSIPIGRQDDGIPNRKPTIGIVVGGGPAPGINGVIHAVTIQAINSGFEVLGIVEGFKHLIAGRPDVRPLTVDDVSRIHTRGGSILKTSRANPAASQETLRTTVDTLAQLGVTHLVSIGGDDTAFSASRVTRHAQEMGIDIRSVHVPKTIDNDLPLPEGVPTFGHETAREMGAQIVKNIMEDALTTGRWYIIVAMGRKAGYLALGIGKSAGATVTLIPEEWQGEPIRMRHVGDIIAGAIVKRLAAGKNHGVALIAEGVMELMSVEDFAFLENIEKDAHGHPRLAEVNSAALIKRQVRDTLTGLGLKTTLVDKELGYELRCADPCAFDVDYTRSLGEAAVAFLQEGGTGAMITIQQNQPRPIPYDAIMDPETGRTEVRMVNVHAYPYQCAQKFMIRLRAQDFQDREWVARMAACTRLGPEAFVQRFGYLGGAAPRPF